MSVIEINKAWCKGCGICIAMCPKQVLGLQENKATVEKAEACISCKLCEYRCPDFAITIKGGEGK